MSKGVKPQSFLFNKIILATQKRDFMKELKKWYNFKYAQFKRKIHIE